MTGKGSLNHNSRKFHAKNTDPNRTHWNVEYCNEDIKDVYHELFDDALKRYNDKQTRKDRKIDDYYEKIRSGKQEKLFHEVILQIGDKDNMGSETMEGQLAAKILDEYMKGFQERNPTLRVFAAHLHLDEATPHLHIDFIPYVTGSKRGLDTRVSLKQALSSLGFKGGSRSETELNQWVQSEKQKLAMVMRENEIEWDQKGTHEQHLSVLDYKKKVREQEVEELTEHKNLLEHDLHDISECVDEIQKEKAQAEKERDAVIKKTEVLEKRFSALNSKAGLVDSHAREYGYYPEEWLPEAGTLESAKSYRKRIFPLVKKVANMIQALYSKYLDLKNKNQKLSDRNIDLENRVDRLREEISVIKKENVALLNVAYDMDRVVGLKRGIVQLEPHDKQWDEAAIQTIKILKSILGDDAIDIQHIGSTAIPAIKAKPIIDIVVGVTDFDKVMLHNEQLRQVGIFYRGSDVERQFLYVMGDMENDTRTHHIHIVKWNGTEWKNYIHFRDYLNDNENMALQYQKVKEELESKYADDRVAYTNGKQDMIDLILDNQ